MTKMNNNDNVLVVVVMTAESFGAVVYKPVFGDNATLL
jgi:hypothetical protein